MIMVVVLLFALFVQRTDAFSLLGPYTGWMTTNIGYRLPGDIGGPMTIDEGYRWNVPYVTYGFDKSFLDYFGSNGVAAVEGAIQIFNDLPPASNIVLTNYPWATEQINAQAYVQGLYDLKSMTLALMVEHLGLAQPTRNVADLLWWTNGVHYPPPPCTNESCPPPPFVTYRNFDPETLTPSLYVNETLYTGYLFTSSAENGIIPLPVDPSSATYSAVADGVNSSGLLSGGFYTDLTRDDVGGLRYLVNATNINWERLPKDVLFTGPQKQINERFRGAWRPGVEKINFIPQPLDKRGGFKTVVFRYSALYVTNGIVLQQPVERIVPRPDILFSVADTGKTDLSIPMFLRTGTGKWVNNASENGSATNAGPGVIVSPIKITFDKLGPIVQTVASLNNLTGIVNRSWGSFDASTNPALSYPPNTGQDRMSVELSFFDTNMPFAGGVSNANFSLHVPFGGQASLEISTNKTDWISLTNVSNSGSIVHWLYYGTNTVPVSFRVVPSGP